MSCLCYRPSLVVPWNQLPQLCRLIWKNWEIILSLIYQKQAYIQKNAKSTRERVYEVAKEIIREPTPKAGKKRSLSEDNTSDESKAVFYTTLFWPEALTKFWQHGQIG